MVVTHIGLPDSVVTFHDGKVAVEGVSAAEGDDYEVSQ